MTNEDLSFTPATVLAEMIRAKQLSPVELLDATLARIDAINPIVNAFCTVTADLARDAARAAEQALMKGEPLGPLCGIPFSIKDLTMTKGVRTMGGSFIHEHRVPDFDAPVVTRLKEAGGVMLGKTTTSEFGWKACGDSPLTGVTGNPWNPAMNSGASSAGAGAGAGAGLGPLHQGSDGAGSVRIPAAFCGIFGLKPSYGRIPNVPTTNNDNASHIGPMTRTVADGALMLAIMAGPDDRDRTSLEGQPADYVGRLNEGIRGLKVGYSPDLGFLRVDAEIAGPVRAAVEAFSELGCQVEEAKIDWGDTSELIEFMWSAHEGGNLGHLLEEWGDRMDPGLVACTREGLGYSAAEYIRKRAEKMAFWDKVVQTFTQYDLLLTPSLSVAAFPVNQLNPDHWPQHEWKWINWAGFSYPFNFTGQPAATVPCGFTAAGLPIGLQIIGQRFDDLRVLQAAAAFEQIRPWAQHRPNLG